MKALMRAIEKFLYKHPRFGIPNLMLYIVVGNAIVFLFSVMDTTGMLLSLLQFDPYSIVHGQIWRLVTFILIPGYTSMSQIMYLAISLYFYYFVGSSLESTWGNGKFTFYYFSGVVLTIIYGFAAWLILGAGTVSMPVTMQYVNLSLFFAFGTLFPDTRILLFFIIPIKVKWLALLSGIVFVYGIVITRFPHNILPIVAILNYIIFCGGYLIDYIRPYVSSGRRSNNTINYKKAAKKVNREMQKNNFIRKCEVCGITDMDNPNMEFRYCSRCEGYHCFCMDHINNHVHFDK